MVVIVRPHQLLDHPRYFHHLRGTGSVARHQASPELLKQDIAHGFAMILQSKHGQFP
jgi:hypothetical protein